MLLGSQSLVASLQHQLLWLYKEAVADASQQF